MTHEKRITRVTIAPKGAEIIDRMAMHVEIDTEGAGEYVAVSQEMGERNSRISIDADEWPLLRETIDEMIARCR